MNNAGFVERKQGNLKVVQIEFEQALTLFCKAQTLQACYCLVQTRLTPQEQQKRPHELQVRGSNVLDRCVLLSQQKVDHVHVNCLASNRIFVQRFAGARVPRLISQLTLAQLQIPRFLRQLADFPSAAHFLPGVVIFRHHNPRLANLALTKAPRAVFGGKRSFHQAHSEDGCSSYPLNILFSAAVGNLPTKLFADEESETIHVVAQQRACFFEQADSDRRLHQNSSLQVEALQAIVLV